LLLSSCKTRAIVSLATPLITHSLWFFCKITLTNLNNLKPEGVLANNWLHTYPFYIHILHASATEVFEQHTSNWLQPPPAASSLSCISTITYLYSLITTLNSPRFFSLGCQASKLKDLQCPLPHCPSQPLKPLLGNSSQDVQYILQEIFSISQLIHISLQRMKMKITGQP
jgi:hypothetical protein